MALMPSCSCGHRGQVFRPKKGDGRAHVTEDAPRGHEQETGLRIKFRSHVIGGGPSHSSSNISGWTLNSIWIHNSPTEPTGAETGPYLM